MIFELTNDLVPILLAFSLYLTVAGAHLANSMIREYCVHHRLKSERNIQAALSLSLLEHDTTKDVLQQLSFLTRIIKRKESPEDDGDYHFSSNSLCNVNNRGGLQWKINLYSLSLKNMLSYSS